MTADEGADDAEQIIWLGHLRLGGEHQVEPTPFRPALPLARSVSEASARTPGAAEMRQKATLAQCRKADVSRPGLGGGFDPLRTSALRSNLVQ